VQPDERELVLRAAKKRLLDAIGTLVIFLALLQAAAWLIVFFQELSHPPIGKFVTVDDVRLHYLSKGAGRAVVFVHGNDGILQDFNLGLLDAAAAKYRAIAFDRPGHGYSQRESGRVATAEVQAELIHDALQKLGISRPIIVGHSWGGTLALAYALKYPGETAAIVFVSGVAYETPETAVHRQEQVELMPVVGDLLISSFVVTARPWVEFASRQAFYPGKAPREFVDTYTSLVMRPGQIKAYAQDEATLNGTIRAISPHYPEIHIPVMIVTGDFDHVVPPSQHAYRLNKAIPDSAIHVIEGARHQIELTRTREIMDAIDTACKMAAQKGTL
jgi:pimeloyl-ACP methyl ester carboxylesterase